MVPVPAARVLEVYALLAVPHTSTEPGSVDPLTTWSAPDLSRLMDLTRSPVTRRMIRHLAQHPDDWIPLNSVAIAIEANPRDIRAALSGFTRTMKAHLGRSIWPFAVAAKRVDGTLQTVYRMPAATADALAQSGPQSPSDHASGAASPGSTMRGRPTRDG
jgi:hypothetical protein